MVTAGAVQLEGLVAAADVLSTARAVEALTGLNLLSQLEDEPHKGITGPRDFQISTVSPGWDALRTVGELDLGNSGTTIRVLAGILAGSSVAATLTGDESLRSRPMGRVIEPLRTMGASIESADEYAPLTINGTPLRGADHTLPMASAQVKSALLFAGLRASGTTSVHEPSPSRDHTERMLRSLGVPVIEDTGRLVVKSTDLQGDWSLKVPGDFSSAAFFLVAAAVMPGSRVTVERVGVNPTRIGLLGVLEAFGAEVIVDDVREEGGEPVGTLTVACRDRRPVEVAAPQTVAAIDELPLVGVLGAFAEGRTVVRDAAELRVKESDRIEATVAALTALGVDATATPDGFVVDGRGGRGVSGGRVDARGDHRIALAAAVAAIAAPEGDSTINGWDSIAISYPWFEQDLAALVVR